MLDGTATAVQNLTHTIEIVSKQYARNVTTTVSERTMVDQGHIRKLRQFTHSK
jgi:hypothetical protein